MFLSSSFIIIIIRQQCLFWFVLLVSCFSFFAQKSSSTSASSLVWPPSAATQASTPKIIENQNLSSFTFNSGFPNPHSPAILTFKNVSFVQTFIVNNFVVLGRDQGILFDSCVFNLVVDFRNLKAAFLLHHNSFIKFVNCTFYNQNSRDDGNQNWDAALILDIFSNSTESTVGFYNNTLISDNFNTNVTTDNRFSTAEKSFLKIEVSRFKPPASLMTAAYNEMSNISDGFLFSLGSVDFIGYAA
jgi:hypothetical protein